MLVRNIHGTDDNLCKCGSWFMHWLIYSNQFIPSHCAVKNCCNVPEVGAHVQICNSIDKRWYIIPLCNFHNGKKGEVLDVDDTIELVSANVNETCGRRETVPKIV